MTGKESAPWNKGSHKDNVKDAGLQTNNFNENKQKQANNIIAININLSNYVHKQQHLWCRILDGWPPLYISQKSKGRKARRDRVYPSDRTTTHFFTCHIMKKITFQITRVPYRVQTNRIIVWFHCATMCT